MVEQEHPFSLGDLLKLGQGCVSLTVKVSPKSHQDTIKGIVNLPHGRIGLAVRVRPPAANGAANEAVTSLFADLFKVRRSCVEIEAGANGRIKVIAIRGDPLTLQARFNTACEIQSSMR